MVAENTPRQTAWLDVVMSLGDHYPTSEYAKMGEERITDIAMAWAHELCDVPSDTVPELYRRARRESNGFPPALAQFEILWGALCREELEKVLEVRAREHFQVTREAAVLYKEMQGEKAPKFVRRFNRFGAEVICDCAPLKWGNETRRPSARLMTVRELMNAGRYDDYEHLSLYRLDQDGCPKYWVCAAGKCGYICDAEKLPVGNHANDQRAMTVRMIETAPPAPPKMDELPQTVFQKVCEHWSVDEAHLDNDYLRQLTSFCEWWGRTFSGVPEVGDWETHHDQWREDTEKRLVKLGVAV